MRLATRRAHAEALWTLERRERRLAERMQRDMVTRHRLKDAITRLRCSMTDADGEAYQKIVFVREGRG